MDTPLSTPTKQCTKCGQTFPATSTHFHPAATGTHGLRAACRACTNAVERKGYKTRRDLIEFQETGHHYIPYYRTCAQCGQTFPRSKTYFLPNPSNHTGLSAHCLYCTTSTQSPNPPSNPPANPPADPPADPSDQIPIDLEPSSPL